MNGEGPADLEARNQSAVGCGGVALIGGVAFAVYFGLGGWFFWMVVIPLCIAAMVFGYKNV